MINRRAMLLGATALTLLPQPALAATRPPREVLTFYYPWYANLKTSGRWFHWRGPNNEAPAQSPTLDTPTLGFYDSHDRTVVETHVRQAKQAGITTLICSWWGSGSFEDQALPAILDICHAHGLKVTVYLEQQKDGQAGANRDMAYLVQHYASHPAWLNVDQRPVMFLYLQALRDLPAAGWRRAADAASPAHRPFLVGDASPRETAQFNLWAPSLDGIHVYVLAPYVKGMTPPEMSKWADDTYPLWQKMIAPRLFCATVIPGFDDTLVPGRVAPRPVVSRHNGQTYQTLWDAAIRHDPDWVVITSFNEWHEGSEIEPSRQYGSRYLDVTTANARKFLRS